MEQQLKTKQKPKESSTHKPTCAAVKVPTSHKGKKVLSDRSQTPKCLQNYYATSSNPPKTQTLKRALLQSLLVVVETRRFHSNF
jgi:hypothetical protein